MDRLLPGRVLPPPLPSRVPQPAGSTLRNCTTRKHGSTEKTHETYDLWLQWPPSMFPWPRSVFPCFRVVQFE